MSIFSNAVATALASLRTLGGETVIYKRGANSVTLTTAKPLHNHRTRNSDDSYILEATELEWAIARAELILAAALITPAEYDTIEWTRHSRKLTYRVLAGTRESCWRWSDTGHTQYRIFTKLDSNVAS